MMRLGAISLLLAAAMLVIGGCSASQQKEVKLTIPDSTKILVTLADTIQTNENRTGDHFAGQLARSVELDGKTVIPEGANVDLVITKLVKGGTLKTPPEIAFTIKDIVLADGNSYSVDANVIHEVGRSHTKREIGMIGGGAAAGAIVGGLMGKGKGAAIGAIAGAAAGTGVAAATGRQNFIYAPGQTVTFTLSRPLTVAVAQK